MRTTIDRAGRVVIQAAIRERAGLTPGSEIEVVEDELGVRLQRVAAGPRLVKIGRRQGAVSEIICGIEPGQKVVVSGQNKLQSGAVVKIDNSIDVTKVAERR